MGEADEIVSDHDRVQVNRGGEQLRRGRIDGREH